jgi:tetracycline resistance efflux pump
MDWLTLLPPLVAIILAIWTREVIISLLAGIWLSESLMTSFNPLLGGLQTLERIAGVFSDPGSARILIFCLLIGALLELVRQSGGVRAFVDRLSHSPLTRGPRQVGALTALVGTAIFIETNISVLTTGTLARSLFDRFKMSRERLAYVLDSTCAPVSVLVLVNAWGAYVLSLLDDFELDNPIEVLVASVPLNFYALLTLVGVFYTVLSNRVHGPLKKFEGAAATVIDTDSEPDSTHARYMLVPLGVLVASMLGFMLYTGEGNILQGSGSKSVLWSVSLAIVVAYLMLLTHGKRKLNDLNTISFEGLSKLLPLVVILLLSMTIGDSLKALGTGAYLAGLIGDTLPAISLAPLLFVVAAAVSFSTGTSWGTFAVMIPIGMPLAFALGVPPQMALAAILGGGVFGDHCSPISDTTVVSSLAAGCNHVDHVRTQLPYALVTGVAAIMLYFLVGLITI